MNMKVGQILVWLKTVAKINVLIPANVQFQKLNLIGDAIYIYLRLRRSAALVLALALVLVLQVNVFYRFCCPVSRRH